MNNDHFKSSNLHTYTVLFKTATNIHRELNEVVSPTGFTGSGLGLDRYLECVAGTACSLFPVGLFSGRTGNMAFNFGGAAGNASEWNISIIQSL